MQIDGPIVVVDDDEDDHYLMQRVLDRLDVRSGLRFFSEARQALEYLLTTTEKPFIIFCDVNMPGMPGIEFRKSINENDYLRKKSIPFVFFSTAAMPSLVQEAYDLNVHGFFIKEQSMDKLEQCVRVILEYWSQCIHPNCSLFNQLVR
jgi:DNA-binding NarL/FixJ family response regulator